MLLSPSLQPVRLEAGLDALLSRCAAYDLVESAIAVCDAQGVLRYANPAFARFNLAVRDSSENFGRHAALLECSGFLAWLKSAVLSGGAEPLRRTFYYAPRITVDLSVCARPLVKTDGEVQGFLLTLGEESIEFGRRHLAQAQESLRTLAERIKVLDREKTANERLIRVLLKEAPFAMVLLDAKRQIFQVNRAAEKLFGVTAAEMVGQSCERFLPCYNECACCPAIDQDRRIQAEEILGMAADRQTLPLLRSVAVVDNDGGAIVVEAFVDLRERKKAERELGKLSEFNQLLVESTGEGIFSVDRELRCTFANRAAASMLGYTPEELLGQDIHTLFHGLREDGTPLPREDLPVMKAIVGNSSHKADEVFWSKAGHPVPIQYLCNPLYEEGRVDGAVVVYRNVAEARALASKMDYLATHDPLTGLPNRRTFEQRLDRALAEVRREEDEHVLCYIDLDQFKIVNDTCGHAAGDELLKQISDMLHARIRKSDIFARLGGDEFGLLLERCSLSQGIPLIEELLAKLAEYRFAWSGKSFSLGASIGVVRLNKTFLTEGNALSAADAACYIAKENGRNRIHVYQPNDQDLVQRQGEMEWVSRIKEALDKDLFELWAQPIVLVENPSAQGDHMEILLRMKGSGGEIVSPGAFIPAAERFGLMAEIDRWVVRQTLACLDKNISRLSALEFCCINLSGPSITDEKFLDFLLEQFAAYPSIVGRLCFEITETAAVANLSRASHFMHRLKTAGGRFALDDFGSGMSSFAYLKNLPVDFLKIDGNFVRDMVMDRIDYAMVEAIHRVGSVIGIKTVAEFVENEEILACLKDIGVDFAQGYGICKPGPLDYFLGREHGPKAVSGHES